MEDAEDFEEETVAGEEGVDDEAAGTAAEEAALADEDEAVETPDLDADEVGKAVEVGAPVVLGGGAKAGSSSVESLEEVGA